MKLLKLWIGKYGIRKVYLVSVVLLLMVGIFISLSVDSTYKRFEIEGVLYEYESVKDHVWTFKDSRGLALIAHTENYQYRLDSDVALHLTYGDQKIKQTSDMESFTSSIYNNDALVYKGELMSFEFQMNIDGDNNSQSKPSGPFEKRLMLGVLSVADHVQSGVLFYFIVLNVLLITLGTAQVFFPLFFWQLKHMLDVRGGEPTDFYMSFTRIVGVIMTGVGTFYPLFY